jgi:hypothetical protein
VRILLSCNSYSFTRNISVGGIIYSLRNRIQSRIYPEIYCYRKIENDGYLFSEALSFWDHMASVIGGGFMSMEDWCIHSDRRRQKGRSTLRKPLSYSHFVHHKCHIECCCYRAYGLSGTPVLIRAVFFTAYCVLPIISTDRCDYVVLVHRSLAGPCSLSVLVH